MWLGRDPFWAARRASALTCLALLSATTWVRSLSRSDIFWAGVMKQEGNSGSGTAARAEGARSVRGGPATNSAPERAASLRYVTPPPLWGPIPQLPSGSRAHNRGSACTWSHSMRHATESPETCQQRAGSRGQWRLETCRDVTLFGSSSSRPQPGAASRPRGTLMDIPGLLSRAFTGAAAHGGCTRWAAPRRPRQGRWRPPPPRRPAAPGSPAGRSRARHGLDASPP